MFEEEWIESNFKLYDPHQDEFVEPSSGGRGRPMSEPSEITDIISTGRKRAAMMYPIFKDMVCEWAHLKESKVGELCQSSVVVVALYSQLKAPTRVTATMGLTRMSSTMVPVMYTAFVQSVTTDGTPSTISIMVHDPRRMSRLSH